MEIKKIRLGGILLPSNVLMAPLAGYTCYPFRMLAYEMGAGLCFTEMSSANALKYQDKATRRLLFTTAEEPVKAVQLLGGIPAVMEEMACGELLAGFDVIDINMGCPVPNVFKSGEGREPLYVSIFFISPFTIIVLSLKYKFSIINCQTTYHYK